MVKQMMIKIMDMPLTPASFAGLDHKVDDDEVQVNNDDDLLLIWIIVTRMMTFIKKKELEERPLTSLTMRREKATVYDEPPEK